MNFFSVDTIKMMAKETTRTLLVLATILALSNAVIPSWESIVNSCIEDPSQGGDKEKARCCPLMDELATEGRY